MNKFFKKRPSFFPIISLHQVIVFVVHVFYNFIEYNMYMEHSACEHDALGNAFIKLHQVVSKII